ncbi:hypothetical protein [Labilibaculum euxinus]
MKYIGLSFLLIMFAFELFAQQDIEIGYSHQLKLQRENIHGDAWILHNAEYSRDNDILKWKNTHNSFGSRGIRFSYSSMSGIHFYADNKASIAGSEFTPTTRFFIGNNGNIGIGTTNPSQKLSIQGGNIYIANGESSTIYSSAHNLYFSGPDNGYAHKGYTFRPAWGTQGDTFTYLMLQTADTKGEYQTKVFFHSAGTSYINGGNLGIGTKDTKGFKLAVKGKIGAEEVQVKANYWSDFVFEDNYQLKKLEEVESYITKNNHLPDVPSEKEVLENGIQLGEMNAKLLQKIEELTLYVIEQNKEIKEMQAIIERNGLK